MTTAYVSHPRYAHHTLPGHPEHAGRIEAVWQELNQAGLLSRMDALSPQFITDDLILEVHTRSHLDLLVRTSKQERMVLIDADTYASPDSFDIARLSAGGVVCAVDAVMTGHADNALAAVRPPGHHATASRAMGFCLLNNVALAAAHARTTHQCERILIVDYDVHHGNGTQDIFYTDDHILFVSSHQYPFYPGTGSFDEVGMGAGRGYTLNIPLPPGHGDASYAQLYESVLWPAARRFKPQLILVSSGFDAHWQDPLAHMCLSLPGYDHLNHELIAMADELCDGKIVFLMEGGYDLTALSHGVCNIARALLGDTEMSDPYGLAPANSEPDIAPVIDRIKQIHRL